MNQIPARCTRANRVHLAAIALLVVGLFCAAPAEAAKKYRMEWHTCHGRAPVEVSCSFRTRFRGWFNNLEPIPSLELSHWAHESDPLAAAPWVCTPVEACVADTFHGTLTVNVEGRTRGWVRASTTWVDRFPQFTYDANPIWGRWEYLDVTVTATGLDPGLPPVGPWEVRVGIPIPIRR